MLTGALKDTEVPQYEYSSTAVQSVQLYLVVRSTHYQSLYKVYSCTLLYEVHTTSITGIYEAWCGRNGQETSPAAAILDDTRGGYISPLLNI